MQALLKGWIEEKLTADCTLPWFGCFGKKESFGKMEEHKRKRKISICDTNKMEQSVQTLE